jgi:hypothetical protein
MRRINLCDFWSPVPVTVQVLTSTASASAPGATSVQPARSNSSRIASVSYWLTLQPSV